MNQSGATLQSVTAGDRDALVTLSALVSVGSNFTTSGTTQIGSNSGSSSASSLGPNTPTLGMNTSVGAGTQGIFLTTAVTMWFWNQNGANPGIWQPTGSPSFPVSTGTAVATATGNSLLFNFNIPIGTQPIQIATVDSKGNVTGNTVPWAGATQHWCMAVLFSLSLPAAGKYSINLYHDDGAFFGMGGGITRVSGPNTVWHANTAVNSLAVMGGNDTNASGGSFNDNYVISAPAGGVYSCEIDFFNWEHNQVLSFRVGAGGSGAPSPYLAPSLWSNASNVLGSGSFATVVVSTTTSTTVSTISQNLDVTQFGFVVPVSGGGVIIGVQVSLNSFVSSFAGSPNTPKLTAQLIFQGSPIGAPITAWSGAGFPTTSTAYALGTTTTMGTWGLGSGSSGSGILTPAMINDPTFGVRFITTAAGTGVTDTVDVNNVKATVYWAQAGAGTNWTGVTNVNSAVSYVTANLASATTTQWLNASSCGFNQPFGFLLSGIGVTINAFGTSNPASISVQLIYQGLRIGSINTQTVTTGAADYTFGGSGNLWGQDVTDLDVINDPTFGVAILMQGIQGDTMNFDNVRVTVYGSSTYNLELISYENANLVGENTYALTSVRRGVYGSYPCDHPIGATFARMDQATLTYTIDPTFQGKVIYFKFLSFNAYGNQLQSLDTVVPYSLQIGGLAPGAIDSVTGALLTGTPNFSVPQHEAVVSVNHGTFGIQNIPAGYGLIGPQNLVAGPPAWIPVITGGGGSGAVANLYVINASGSFTAQVFDDILCNTAGGSFNVTFPLASLSANSAIAVQKNSSDANVVTILPAGGNTIQGRPSITIAYFGDSLYFVSDGGSNWAILSGWIQPVNDLYIYIPPTAGVYVAAQELFYSIPVHAFTLAISLAGSHAGCRTAPTGSIAVTINKNGVSIGTVNIAGGATTATFTFASAVAFNGLTDILQLVAPGSPDATFAGFWVDFQALRTM
jgi:hypothetical protein